MSKSVLTFIIKTKQVDDIIQQKCSQHSVMFSSRKVLINTRPQDYDRRHLGENEKWGRPQSLLWRHNGLNGVSNHQPYDCLLNRLFRRRSQKTSKLRVNGLCEGNSPVTGEVPAQRTSHAENVSIWWRHHVYKAQSTTEIVMLTTEFVRLLKCFCGWRFSFWLYDIIQNGCGPGCSVWHGEWAELNACVLLQGTRLGTNPTNSTHPANSAVLQPPLHLSSAVDISNLSTGVNKIHSFIHSFIRPTDRPTNLLIIHSLIRWFIRPSIFHPSYIHSKFLLPSEKQLLILIHVGLQVLKFVGDTPLHRDCEAKRLPWSLKGGTQDGQTSPWSQVLSKFNTVTQRSQRRLVAHRSFKRGKRGAHAKVGQWLPHKRRSSIVKPTLQRASTVVPLLSDPIYGQGAQWSPKPRESCFCVIAPAIFVLWRVFI